MLRSIKFNFEFIPTYGLNYLRAIDVKKPIHAAKLLYFLVQIWFDRFGFFAEKIVVVHFFFIVSIRN